MSLTRGEYQHLADSCTNKKYSEALQQGLSAFDNWHHVAKENRALKLKLSMLKRIDEAQQYAIRALETALKHATERPE